MSVRKIYIIVGAVAVALVLFYLLMMPEGILASNIQWRGVYGQREEEPSTVYFLIDYFFFPDEMSDDIDQVIAQWLAVHPRARAVPVFTVFSEENEAGSKTRSLWDLFGTARAQFVHVWVLDGDECLNSHLVRRGCCPADSMDIISDWRQHATEAGFYCQLLVSEERYRKFIKKVSAAQEQARKEKLGIWETK